METETKRKLREMAKPYFEMFGVIREKIGDEQITIAIFREICKDRRMREIRAERKAKAEHFEDRSEVMESDASKRTATPKQLAFLKRLGVEADENMTMKDASRAIDEAKAQLGDD